MATFSKDVSQMPPPGVECQLDLDGTKNPKYVDLLDEDKPVAGQKFACVSFLSPEGIIRSKEIFCFDEFLKQWELSKSLEKYTQFMSFLSFKYSLNFDDLTKDLQEFCAEEKGNLFNTDLSDEYKTFMDNNEERLDSSFSDKHNFQTSVRGLKIRGSYPSQQEAELRCKMLREVDPNHDVFVGPVGMWMPYHPEAYKTGRVEYLEDELNQLMHEKNKNETQAKVEFDKRIKEAKVKAMEENKKKAMESGNLLTQTLDKDGNLVSVNDINTMESNMPENVAVADIRKELFEDDNVVIDYKNSDHGRGELSENQKDSQETVEINLSEAKETPNEQKDENIPDE